MFGGNKDTKKELTPQEQKIVKDELTDFMNNYQELFKNGVIKNFEISDGLVDFEGFNAYECDVKKVVKAIWVYKTECGTTFRKQDEDSILFKKFWEDYVQFKLKLKSRYNINCVDFYLDDTVHVIINNKKKKVRESTHYSYFFYDAFI